MIKRQDSGSPHQDRTADAYYILPGAIDAACLRHSERFNTSDLIETIEEADLEPLLAAVKAGDTHRAGALLVKMYAERIGDLAVWSLS